MKGRKTNCLGMRDKIQKKDRQTDRQTGRQTNRQKVIYSWDEGQITKIRQTDRQIDTGRQTNRQTGRKSYPLGTRDE